MLVRDDGSIVLIDLEVATLAGDERAPDARDQRLHGARLTDRLAVDRYALACLRLFVFLPQLTALLTLDVGQGAAARGVDRRGVPVPEEFLAGAVNVIESAQRVRRHGDRREATAAAGARTRRRGRVSATRCPPPSSPPPRLIARTACSPGTRGSSPPPAAAYLHLGLLGVGGGGGGGGFRLAWSTVQAIPAFVSGRLVAEAIDDGFLAGRTGRGFVWLGLLGLSAIVGAWATRHTFMRLAGIVEPFRDELAKLAVTGALRRSAEAGAAGDTAGVSRLTQQVEIVRDAYGSILLVGQNFLVVTVGALLGMLTLMPEMLVLVVPPLVVGVAIFLAALGHMAARQRDSIMAEERMAERMAALAADIRDVEACGAEDQAAPMVGEHIEAQARATHALARLTAVRVVAIAVGGLLPVVLILVGGSWLVARGATAGMIFGALTYVLLGVQPALQTFVDGISGPGLWLMVTLRRILEASHGLLDAADAEAAGRRRGRGASEAGRASTGCGATRPGGAPARARSVSTPHGSRRQSVPCRSTASRSPTAPSPSR